MALKQWARQNSYSYFKPVNPKSNQHLNSPYSYTAKLCIEIMRIKGDDHQGKKALIVKKILLARTKWNVYKSMENMDTDVRV